MISASDDGKAKLEIVNKPLALRRRLNPSFTKDLRKLFADLTEEEFGPILFAFKAALAKPIHTESLSR